MKNLCSCLHVEQVIQTFSAKDQDLPSAGQQFSFKSPKEDTKNKNFTIRDFGSKTSVILGGGGAVGDVAHGDGEVQVNDTCSRFFHGTIFHSYFHLEYYCGHQGRSQDLEV